MSYQFSYDDVAIMPVTDLQKIFPAIKWLDYLNKVLTPDHLKSTETIVMFHYSYFEKFFELIAKTPKRVVANFVSWSFFNNINLDYKLLSSRIENTKRKFLHDLRGEKFYSLEIKCVNSIAQNMKLAMNIFYLKKNFDPKKKEYIVTLAENIRASFQRILNDVSFK